MSLNFKELVYVIIKAFINPIIWLIFAATIVFFMWNIFGVIKNSDNPEELAKFKSKALWGIIAIAVMTSTWGLVKFVTNSLNLNQTTGINVRVGR
ncbi:MAG: hypothetical protein HZB10_01845 [Candidatus Yonathbacteria bacterium]|nr:hypothetical protein [Candidatus Yonathbacteria bacterium]